MDTTTFKTPHSQFEVYSVGIFLTTSLNSIAQPVYALVISVGSLKRSVTTKQNKTRPNFKEVTLEIYSKKKPATSQSVSF